MNYVEPIRSKEKIAQIAGYLKERSLRDYVMFVFGVYTGRRISDILNLKAKDVKDVEYLKMRESKTGKTIHIPIHPRLKGILDEYVTGMRPEEYLFKSSQKQNKPIDRSTAYKILRDAGGQFCLKSIGTHTLRKTFGYHLYQESKDIVTLMEIFGHTHPSVTLRYIGVNQSNINRVVRGLSLE